MMAPDELSRKRNTVLGATRAITTQPKPIADEHKMAMYGTPRPLSLTNCIGASRRSASTNNMRDAV